MRSIASILPSFALSFLLLLSVIFQGAAQPTPWAHFTVKAGAYDRENTPVSASLSGLGADLSAAQWQLLEIRDGQKIPQPFQVIPGDPLRIAWILAGKTPAGSERRFEFTQTAEKKETASAGVQVRKNKGAVQIRIDGKEVLDYAYEPPPLPEGVSDLYIRDGFIHPLWSPKGEVLTRIQPPDHYHHYGLWNPWTRTESEGRKIDYWNLYEGQGTVRTKVVPSLVSGPVFGGFAALHEHIDLTAPDPSGRKTMLNETWEVKVWNADPDNKIWLVDFTSKMNPATDSLFTIEAYRYQGFGLRATEKWDDQTARLLTSEGKDKSTGNATRARWCDVNGVSDFGTSGILFMTHPHNHNFPEQLRIWPTGANGGKENVFFNFNPAQEQDWVLKPGREYVLQYRMMLYDGKISTDVAERYWYDFAHPPKVEVMTVPSLQGKKALVFTKNGEGYVHDNIAVSVAALKKLGEENGFSVDASDDPAVMTEDNLRKYDVLIFSNTNNETFDTEAQRMAFQRYIQSGGGFVGIHIASGSERQWPWYWKMIGGKFVRHPKLQSFDIHVIDPAHPSTTFLPKVWKWEDECYFLDQLNPDIHVLLAADLNTVEDEKKVEYPGTTFGQYAPLSWRHEFEGGRQWYTALGHKSEYYSDPDFLKHLLGGIAWAVSR